MLKYIPTKKTRRPPLPKRNGLHATRHILSLIYLSTLTEEPNRTCNFAKPLVKITTCCDTFYVEIEYCMVLLYVVFWKFVNSLLKIFHIFCVAVK